MTFEDETGCLTRTRGSILLKHSNSSRRLSVSKDLESGDLFYRYLNREVSLRENNKTLKKNGKNLKNKS